MPRPRGKSSLTPRRVIEVPLELDLLDAVDARLFDPKTGKAEYGARPALITRLLRDWVSSTPVNPKVQAFLESQKPSMTLEDLLSTVPNQ